jgi:Capsule polysaccharide biosynthesis protein
MIWIWQSGSLNVDDMIARLKKLVANVPLLRTPLQLARRIWKDRSTFGAIVSDLRNTRHETAFLRSYESPFNERTVMILAVDDDAIYRVKLEALLATGLRLAGWRPIVVFRNRSCLLGRSYFKAFGIRDYIYLDDIRLNADEREQCRQRAEVLMKDVLDLQMVKSWCFHDSWIGPQMISTLSRLRFEGTPDFTDPAVRDLLATFLPGTLEHALRAKKLVALFPVDLAIVNEANYSIFGPLVDMCISRGTSVVQFIQPWKDDALIFKRLTTATRREHPASVDRTTLDRIVGQPWTATHEEKLWNVFSSRYSGKWFLQARNQRNTQRCNREQLIENLGLDPGKKIAVVFSHMLWDANLFYGEDLFKDYGEWFVRTVAAACANPNLNWLIKIHPANVWKRTYEKVAAEYAEVVLIRRAIGDLPAHVKLIPADSDISTYSLFQSIDYGVTVRGTSGMELACFGKPCITAGTGRYAGLGFTVDSSTREEYLSQLARLHEQPPMTDEEVIRAKWHAYAAFILRPWSMKSVQSEFSYQNHGTHPLDHNLCLIARSVAEITCNGDLSEWASWASGPEVDYVATENKS